MAEKKSSVVNYETNLEEILRKRAIVEEALINLEREIYSSEESYLAEAHGNVIRGWDGLLSSNTSNKRSKLNRQNPTINEEDRMFSNSSVTSMAAVSGILNPDDVKNERGPSSSRRESSVIKNSTDISTGSRKNIMGKGNVVCGSVKLPLQARRQLLHSLPAVRDVKVKPPIIKSGCRWVHGFGEIKKPRTTETKSYNNCYKYNYKQ